MKNPSLRHVSGAVAVLAGLLFAGARHLGGQAPMRPSIRPLRVSGARKILASRNRQANTFSTSRRTTPSCSGG